MNIIEFFFVMFRIKPRNLNKYNLRIYPEKIPDVTESLSLQVIDIQVKDGNLVGVSSLNPSTEEEKKRAYTLSNITSDTFYHQLHQQQVEINSSSSSSSSSFSSSSVSNSGHHSKYNSGYHSNPSSCCHAFLYGCTDKGVSICVIVPFRPSLLLIVPDQWSSDEYEHLMDYICWRSKLSRDQISFQHKVSRQFYGWIPDDVQNPTKTKEFQTLRVFVPSLDYVRTVSNMFRYGDIRSIRNIKGNNHKIEVHEHSIEGDTQFCDRYGIRPGGWIRVNSGYWQWPKMWYTHCIMEVHVQPDTLAAIDYLPDKKDTAPLLLASIDGEMFDPNNRFPQPNRTACKIICWSNSFYRVGSKHITRVIYATAKDWTKYTNRDKTESNLAEDAYKGFTIRTIVEWFQNEYSLLVAIRDLWAIYSDPDWLFGWNNFAFDHVYQDKRMRLSIVLQQLQLKNKSETTNAEEISENTLAHVEIEKFRYWYASRMISQLVPLVEEKFSSDAVGYEVRSEYSMYGRITNDMHQYIKRNEKYSNYTLDEVSKQILKTTKIDLPASQINRCYEDDCMEEVVEYNGRDSDLPIFIALKKNIVGKILADSRIYYTNPNTVLKGGQQVRVIAQIIIFAHSMNIYITSDGSVITNDSYEGATVVDPDSGWYNIPIVVLDFASLYPSIMRYYRLCPSTLVLKEEYKNLPGVKYNIIKTDCGTFHFVHSINGVLVPCVSENILTQLVTTRNNIKKLLKNYDESSQEYQNLSSDEQSVKGSTNSVYGIYGAQKGKMKCMPVAASTTACGRRLLQEVKTKIMTRRPGTKIIYGDTDSVFIMYAGLTATNEGLKQAFEWGGQDAKFCSESYDGIIKLEQDKLMLPLMLEKKKRYAGLLFKEPDVSKPDKMVTKGIQMVRTDQCELLKQLQALVIKTILYERNPEKAVQLFKSQLMRLHTDPLETLVPLVTFTAKMKSEQDYAKDGNSIVQVQVMRKIRERNPGSEPKSGDKVQFVYIHDPNASLKSERGEDPKYVIEHKLPLDKLGVIERIQTALEPWWSVFVERPNELYKDVKRLVSNKVNNVKEITCFNGFGTSSSNLSPASLVQSQSKPVKSIIKTGLGSVIQSDYGKKKNVKCKNVMDMFSAMTSTSSNNNNKKRPISEEVSVSEETPTSDIKKLRTE